MKKENAIDIKSKRFAVRIVRFYKYLCDEKQEYVISKQILKSGTSIGANVREAKNAQSPADFSHKMNIALKEADETAYWLEILKDSTFISDDEFVSIYNDNNELIKLLTAIIKTTKKKLGQLIIDN